MPSITEGDIARIPVPDLALVGFFVQQPEAAIVSACHG